MDYSEVSDMSLDDNTEVYPFIDDLDFEMASCYSSTSSSSYSSSSLFSDGDNHYTESDYYTESDTSTDEEGEEVDTEGSDIDELLYGDVEMTSVIDSDSDEELFPGDITQELVDFPSMEDLAFVELLN